MKNTAKSQKQAAKPARNPALVRLIRYAISQLGLREDEYRALYEDATGKRQVRDMDNYDLNRVIIALKRNGFQGADGGGSAGGNRNVGDNRSAQAHGEAAPAKAPRPVTGNAGTAPLADSPKARKIRSLWLTLRDLGALRDSSERALLSYIEKRTGYNRMEWLQENQLTYIIEQLKQWVGRVSPRQSAT